MSNLKPKITAEALALVREHPLANNESFLLALSEALAGLHHTATAADRIAALNETTAAFGKRLDADEIAKVRAETVKAERKRIHAILTCPEAEGRGTVAQALALDSDLPVAAAIEALKAAPRRSPISDWSAKAAEPVEPVAVGMRTADAPGGLLAYDPKTGEQIDASVDFFFAAPSPVPTAAANSAKSLWKSAVGALNREAEARSATGNSRT